MSTSNFAAILAVNSFKTLGVHHERRTSKDDLDLMPSTFER